LTTLRQDPHRIAKEVVSILDRRIADPDSPPVSVYFPVELVVRETVKVRHQRSTGEIGIQVDGL
ncbi:hypothetical protein EN856_39490, partial [Mesorhizobium sp. M8A.F.Ca.ET.213.01.1.1]